MPRIEKSEATASGQNVPARSAVGRYPGRRRPRHATRRGVTAIEYCLLLSLVSVVGITGVQRVGLGAKGVFGQVPGMSSSQPAPATSGSRLADVVRDVPPPVVPDIPPAPVVPSTPPAPVVVPGNQSSSGNANSGSGGSPGNSGNVPKPKKTKD